MIVNVAAGAPLAEISRRLYRTKPDVQLRLFGRVLDRLQTAAGGLVGDMNGIVTEAVYPVVSRDHDGMPMRIFYFDGTQSDLDRDLAKKMDWPADRGEDHLGYDIRSFAPDNGEERLFDQAACRQFLKMQVVKAS